MAYKNSGAMKFNDATDLVIRADPDGTVESCYNRSNFTEYVGPYSPLQLVSAEVVNTGIAAHNIFFVRESSGYIDAYSGGIAAGGTTTVSVVRNSIMKVTSVGYTLSVVSGEAEALSTTQILIKGACRIEMVE